MNKYEVKMLPKAYNDLDLIYTYIKQEIKVLETALETITAIEEAIFSLEKLPYRGAERKVGIYAHRGYRQMFANNFTIIYRIDERTKSVIIVTVKYSHSNL